MSTAAVPAARRNQVRILVASADPLFRKLFKQVSTDAHEIVEEAVSGAHALSKLESIAVDVLVLDRHLPDLDSQEVAELARRRYAGLEVRLVDSQAVAEKISAELRAPTGPPMMPPAATKTEPEADDDVSPLPGMVGRARGMQQVYRLARLVDPLPTRPW